MPSTQLNEKFTQNILVAYPLDDSIEWIKKNMDPDDVFDDEQLEQWAIDYMPVDRMPESELTEWAEKNGYAKA